MEVESAREGRKHKRKKTGISDKREHCWDKRRKGKEKKKNTLTEPKEDMKD